MVAGDDRVVLGRNISFRFPLATSEDQQDVFILEIRPVQTSYELVRDVCFPLTFIQSIMGSQCSTEESEDRILSFF